MKAGDELRDIIEFRRLNLNDEDYSLGGRFDLIFCRNVLIYFSVESRMRVVRRLLSLLRPTGYLFVGHAESLGGMSEVRGVMPTIYRLRQEPGVAELSEGFGGDLSHGEAIPNSRDPVAARPAAGCYLSRAPRCLQNGSIPDGD